MNTNAIVTHANAEFLTVHTCCHGDYLFVAEAVFSGMLCVVDQVDQDL